MLIIVTNIMRKKIWPSSVHMGEGPPIAPGLSVNIETLGVEVP